MVPKTQPNCDNRETPIVYSSMQLDGLPVTLACLFSSYKVPYSLTAELLFAHDMECHFEPSPADKRVLQKE